jgi:hypothetical protein
VQIADHQQLHPAEGQLGAAVTPQHAIHAIKQIGPDHADFINDQQIEASDDIDFLPAEPVTAGLRFAARDERTKGHLKKGMQGNPTGIDGSDTGRGRYHQALGGLFLNGMEKGGFTRAGFSRQKDMAVGMLNEFFGDSERCILGTVHWTVSKKGAQGCLAYRKRANFWVLKNNKFQLFLLRAMIL